MLLGLLASMLSLSSVTDCSKGAFPFKITSMSLLPDPPVKGQNSTLLLSMNVPTEVQGGTATYSVTYNFIKITPEVKNLCDEVPGGCPIYPGQLNTVSSFPLQTTLSGTIKVLIQWKDIADVDLLCVAITMKV